MFKLAQGITNPELVEGGGLAVERVDPGASFALAQGLNIVLSIGAVVALITLTVLWIMMIIQVLSRKDLKESKILWILLLLFVSPIGMIAYGFVENRKKLGVITIIATIAIPVLLSAFAISNFVLAATL